VNKRLRKEIADAGTVLRKKVNELVTSQPEQMPTTLDITKILRLPVDANITLFNSDYVDLRKTPPVETSKVNLQPSPSPPPAVPLPQAIPDVSPAPPNRPSQGDAVLVFFMDNGRMPDIARKGRHGGQD